MTSHDTKVAKEMESLKLELDYWKESYLILESKYQRLASCHKCVVQEELTQQPSKRVLRKRKLEQIDNSSMDPLKLLPEPCTRAIMKYLSGKELLNIMEVSKSWKEFVECRKSLMNRAMNEIVVKPTIEDYSLPMVNYLVDNSDKRRYKNMKSPFVLHRKFVISKLINPMEIYASTLENLIIKGSKCYDNSDDGCYCYDDYEMQPCTFPVLRKLNIEYDDESLVSLRIFEREYSCPMLTHLKINFEEDIRTFDELKKSLAKYPKLETLHYDYDEATMEYEEENEVEDIAENTLTEVIHPKLKNIYINDFNKKFLNDYKNSLVKLEVQSMDYKKFVWLLQNLNVLKSLTISNIYKYVYSEDRVQEENFLANESIEVFKMDCVGIYEDDETVEATDHILRLLLALPSLRDVVILNSLTKEIMLFLASNMHHLKTLTCREINQQLKLAYEEIRNNPDRYINSSFDFIADPHHKLYEIQDEFI